MTKTTKGTPRKRPYDVKRKLERAIDRVKKNGLTLTTGLWGLFSDGEKWCATSGGRVCALGAYLAGRPSTGSLMADACAGLGLADEDVCDIVFGFDNTYSSRESDIWYKLGQELRSHIGI